MIANPCRKLCALDPTGRFCLGCGRTRDEIGRWLLMTDPERQAVLDRLAAKTARSAGGGTGPGSPAA